MSLSALVPLSVTLDVLTRLALHKSTDREAKSDTIHFKDDFEKTELNVVYDAEPLIKESNDEFTRTSRKPSDNNPIVGSYKDENSQPDKLVLTNFFVPYLSEIVAKNRTENLNENVESKEMILENKNEIKKLHLNHNMGETDNLEVKIRKKEVGSIYKNVTEKFPKADETLLDGKLVNLVDSNSSDISARSGRMLNILPEFMTSYMNGGRQRQKKAKRQRRRKLAKKRKRKDEKRKKRRRTRIQKILTPDISTELNSIKAITATIKNPSVTSSNKAKVYGFSKGNVNSSTFSTKSFPSQQNSFFDFVPSNEDDKNIHERIPNFSLIENEFGPNFNDDFSWDEDRSHNKNNNNIHQSQNHQDVKNKVKYKDENGVVSEKDKVKSDFKKITSQDKNRERAKKTIHLIKSPSYKNDKPIASRRSSYGYQSMRRQRQKQKRNRIRNFRKTFRRPQARQRQVNLRPQSRQGQTFRRPQARQGQVNVVQVDYADYYDDTNDDYYDDDDPQQIVVRIPPDAFQQPQTSFSPFPNSFAAALPGFLTIGGLLGLLLAAIARYKTPDVETYNFYPNVSTTAGNISFANTNQNNFNTGSDQELTNTVTNGNTDNTDNILTNNPTNSNTDTNTNDVSPENNSNANPVINVTRNRKRQFREITIWELLAKGLPLPSLDIFNYRELDKPKEFAMLRQKIRAKHNEDGIFQELKDYFKDIEEKHLTNVILPKFAECRSSVDGHKIQLTLTQNLFDFDDIYCGLKLSNFV